MNVDGSLMKLLEETFWREKQNRFPKENSGFEREKKKKTSL